MTVQPTAGLEMTKFLRFPETQDEALWAMIGGYVAQNADDTVRLRRSRGRRKAGRPTRYTVTETYTPDGDIKGWFHVTAWTDEEALEKANTRLEKE